MICIERRIAKCSYEIRLSMFTSIRQKDQNQGVHLAPSYSQSNGLHTVLFDPLRKSGQTTWVPYIEPTGIQFDSKLGTIELEVSCMSSRVINVACARAINSRHSALVMFFYMCLEKHVCNAMSRGLFILEYVELLLVRWRARAT
jgi:hypothetical protein